MELGGELVVFREAAGAGMLGWWWGLLGFADGCGFGLGVELVEDV